MKKIHALVDADIVLYQASAAVERETDWGDDMWTLHADASEAKQVFDTTIADIREATRATRVTLCFSGAGNFRIRIHPDYKANRVATRKPICYAEVRRYAFASYQTACYPGIEADDVIGMMATAPSNQYRPIIVSEDKDLRSVPGTLWNPRTRERSRITKAAADRQHLFQTLTGDRTDNYPGCPGIGEVKAGRILDEDCSWDAVVRAFVAAGQTEQDALVQARLARILRHGEYDHATAEVKLWTPGKKSRIRGLVKSSPPAASVTPEPAKVDTTC